MRSIGIIGWYQGKKILKCHYTGIIPIILHPSSSSISPLCQLASSSASHSPSSCVVEIMGSIQLDSCTRHAGHNSQYFGLTSESVKCRGINIIYPIWQEMVDRIVADVATILESIHIAHSHVQLLTFRTTCFFNCSVVHTRESSGCQSMPLL